MKKETVILVVSASAVAAMLFSAVSIRLFFPDIYIRYTPSDSDAIIVSCKYSDFRKTYTFSDPGYGKAWKIFLGFESRFVNSKSVDLASVIRLTQSRDANVAMAATRAMSIIKNRIDVSVFFTETPDPK